MLLTPVRLSVIYNLALISTLSLTYFKTVNTQDLNSFQSLFQQDANSRLQKSRDMQKYMNLSADPCVDFYEFACGNWLKYHLVNNYEHEIKHKSAPPVTLDYYMHNEIDNELKNMLQEQLTTDDGTNGRIVKDFYKSCWQSEKNGQQQQAFFSELIKNNGGFPAVPGTNWLMQHQNYNWQEVIAQLRQRYGMDILIGLTVDLNINSSYNFDYSIYLGEPSTIIPTELCSAEVTKRIDILDEQYDDLQKEIAENLRHWLTLEINEAKKVAIEILTFEFELCTGMKLNMNNYFSSSSIESTLPNNYERRTLFDLRNKFNNSIDFYQYTTRSFDIPVYKPVFMTAEGYFRHLIKTIEHHNTTTIANYIMYKAISTLSFPLSNRIDRKKYCLQIIKKYLPKQLGRMYQEKYANKGAKNDVQMIFDKLKEMFAISLGSNWIDDYTSRSGKSKLSNIILNFSNYERMLNQNMQINPNNYWQNLALVSGISQQQDRNRISDPVDPEPKEEIESYDPNLKYQSIHKRIDIGWALLQSPYFRQYYPNAISFAMIGHRLATELSTAFENLSWTSEFLGISNRDRMTEGEFQNRTECFRQQLSNYLYDNPFSFQNYTKLREIIAASNGLNVAFNAYISWLSFLNPNNDFTILSKETLTEFNFSNTQLFFISFAQMHCQSPNRYQPSIRPTPIYSFLQNHSLNRYAVNGPLRNSKEFSRDFGCMVGTEMNPVDKCIIF